MNAKVNQSKKVRGGLRDTPVAIIGMASIMPEAHHLQEYWDNILNKINCIFDVPASRWNVEDYYDPDPSAPDKIYCKRGGFIPDIDFDPMEFGLPPNILEVTDVAQLLSLVVARDALEDAGYGEGRDWDRELTGVILGLVGMSMKTFVPLMNRLQYPVWQKVLRSAGVSESDVQVLVEKMKKAYIGWEENAFPGTLANVVAGRIANRFDLGGTNAAIDAACASSMAAFKMAVEELVEHRADMMLAGGVDADNTIASYISFSKTPAFTRQEVVKTFDADSSGMMVGEGIGICVLKRLEDAERDGDRIYAVIRGIGSSSDGRFKSIYAPRAAGQAKALRRAYEEAGYSPATVSLIEAHGTGTMAGDPAEVEGLRIVFGEDNPNKQYIGLGSVKSQIGHTKAAAGAASMIKTTLALYNKVLPPTLNVTKPNPKLELEGSSFYINTETRPWFRLNPDTPRRAGVSSFGFGGTNFHVALEEYSAENKGSYRKNRVAWPVIISAATPDALVLACSESLANLQSDEAKRHYAELVNRSRAVVIPLALARLGFVADSPAEAADLLKQAIDTLKKQPEAEAWENPKGLYYRKSGMESKGKIVALFPGQGSQYLEMGKELALNFPTVRGIFEQMDKLFRQKDGQTLSGKVFPRPVFDPKEREALEKTLQQTENAQPAIGTLSAALYQVLVDAGFQADFTAGHSFGEWTALWAAGVLDLDDYLKAAFSRGQAMAAPDDPNFDAGTMLAVKGDVEKIKQELKSFPDVTLANYNSNNQVVLAGSKPEIARVQKALAVSGFSVVPLQVSAAFHTKLVGHAQKPFAKSLEKLTFQNPDVKVFSNSTGKSHMADPKAIQATMVDHILNPVLFRDEIEAIYAEGGSIFVEFGPKSVLTNLVDSILADRPHLAVALNGSAKKDSDRQLREGVVRLKVAGVEFGDFDPFALPLKEEAPKKKSAITVTLNGGLYMTEKTRKAFEDTLKDGWKISQAEPQVVVKEVEKIVEVAQPSSGVMVSETSTNFKGLESVLNRFESLQKDSVRVHEQYLQNEAEYGKIFAQLTQAELGVVANNPNQTGLQALESLERSLQRFQEHQAETLRIHEQYLKSQDEFSRGILALAQQQIGSQSLSVAQQPRPAVQPVERPAPAPKVEVQVTKPPALSGNGHSIPTAPAPVVPVSLPSVTAPVKPALAPSQPAGHNLQQNLLKVVSEKTGYPQEMLDLTMDMEADLGIDSIKRVEILGAIQQIFPEMPRPEPETLAELHTLQQILDFMKSGVSTSNESAVPAAPVAAPALAISAPAAAQPVTSGLDLKASLLTIVAEKTGYPQEMLELDMDMEADLGIDSIKRVEILGALSEALPGLPRPEPEQLAEMRTLGLVLAFMNQGNPITNQPTVQPEPALSQPAPAPAPVGEQTQAGASSEEIAASLLKVVSEKTGYPQEMLEVNMDMEADLGIDSIKRVEILGAVQQLFPDLPKPEPETLAELHTLQQVIDFLAQGAVKEPAQEAQRPFA